MEKLISKIGTTINAVAPIRICDIGGWTDTWFAKHGAVFNISVYPYVEVQIEVKKAHSKEKFVINVENYGDKYSFDPSNDNFLSKHPLIEASLSTFEISEDVCLHINIYSDAPPGASTGTSAAVSVALLGALGEFKKDKLTAHEVAILAHSIETEKLHLQCGVQDQLASAYGGINYIEILDFPHSIVSPINIPDNVWWELEHRLGVVYLGKPHKSSDIHKKVIEDLGKDPSGDVRLLQLANLAKMTKNALLNSDFYALGNAMNHNTYIQKSLHPSLVSEQALEIINKADYYGAFGCKVNGAGGDGGSITILFDSDREKKRKFMKEVSVDDVHCLPIYLSRKGLRVWKSM